MTIHARCPVCHQPPFDITGRIDNGIAFADFVCANEHVWETKWPIPPSEPRAAS